MESQSGNVTFSVTWDANLTKMVVEEFEADIISHDSDSSRNEKSVHIANLIVLGVIFGLTLLGNGVVVVVLLLRYLRQTEDRDVDESTNDHRQFRSLHRKSGMRLTNMQWFMLNLSIADIMVAFFTMLSQFIWDNIIWFYGGNAWCKVFKYVQLVPMYASTYCMLMLAIDRYIVVCHKSASPRKQTRRVYIMTIIAWAFSFLLALPQLFIFSLWVIAPGHAQCYASFEPLWTSQLYVTSFTFAVFLIPLAILVFCYARICCDIWGNIKCSATYRHNDESADGGKPRTTAVFRQNHSSGERFYNPDELPLQENRSSLAEVKIKTLKLSVTVIIAFIVCWSPFICVQLWAAFDVNAPVNITVFVVIMRMANLNSCTNPWIYLFFSALWRRSGKDTLLKSFINLELPSSTESSKLEMETVQQGI